MQIREALLEGQCQEEAGEDLHAGLDYPELLEDVGPVAVETLGGCLVADAIVPFRICAWRCSGLGTRFGAWALRPGSVAGWCVSGAHLGELPAQCVRKTGVPVPRQGWARATCRAE